MNRIILLTLHLFLFLLIGICPAPQQVAGAAKKFNFDGEYGLWVVEKNGQITVRWITAKSDSGVLKVYEKEDEIASFITPLGQAHKAEFSYKGNSRLLLDYGSCSDSEDRHQTTISLHPKRPDATISGTDSIYVLGDIHGNYNDLVTLLKSSRIIDERSEWSGGKKQLIVMGDIFDRGLDVIKTLWLLYDLDLQAADRGGRVHLILGNHEIMAMGNDMRYVAGKERVIADSYGVGYSEMFDARASILGRWLASKPAILKIDNILFAHGGVTNPYSEFSIEALNDSLFTYLNEDVFVNLLADSIALAMIDSTKYQRRLHFFYGDESIFWFRDYVQTDTLEDELKRVLRKQKANVHVVAHTPVDQIGEFYDGRLIGVDLKKPATEMLLLARQKKHKYKRYRVTLDGSLFELQDLAPVEEPVLMN